VTDANVGRAGTIDIFKLYNETFLEGEENPVEISRGLIKFDVDSLAPLTQFALNETNFKCFLSLKSIETGHFTPSNFKLRLYPVSQNWSEGLGRDVTSFSDIDVSNFITASFAGGTVNPWFESGADKKGLLGSNDIDIISSGNIGAGIENLFVQQTFEAGNEDLYVDVTKIVSSTLTGLIPNHGFRISLGPDEESDQKTYFVKRFFSRHTNSALKVPSLRVIFDDTIKDDHESFYFNTTGSLFISNTVRGTSQNIRSGSNLSEISGDNCLLLRISTGSNYEKFLTASSYTPLTLGDPAKGLYTANFCIPYSDNSIVISGTQNLSVYDIALASGSIKFKTEWLSLDRSVIFATGSVTVKKPKIAGFNSISQAPTVRIINLRNSYTKFDNVRFRLFGRNLDNKIHPPVKLPIYERSEYFDDVFYSVRELISGEVIIPFEREHNGTRVSRDSEGMFFDFRMSTLPPGKSYYFEYLVATDGFTHTIVDSKLNFRIEK
jgi:hypothetical protein